MRLAILGLGRMGANMAKRLLRDGHEVVGFNRSPDPLRELEAAGGIPCPSLDGLTARLDPPRVVWSMVPAGAPTEQIIDGVAGILERGDVVVDGGNAQYRDSIRRAADLEQRGIHFLDAGVSGGVWGLEEGYCLMVGGEADAVALVEPAFRTLAPPDGFAHVGPAGAGHFAKMVHNGVEYAMLQAYAEGFELLHAADEFPFDLHQIAALWRRGSVVRSWLLDLLERALAEDPALGEIRGWVDDSGEGRWTVQEAVERAVPATAVAHALFARFASRQDDSFAMRVIAALRNEFGGHPVKREGE